MKIYVQSNQMCAALHAAGFSEPVRPPYFTRTPDGRFVLDPDDGNYVIIEVQINPDGTWGFGSIQPIEHFPCT